MKMKFFALMLTLTFAGVANANLLSCEASAANDPANPKFTGTIKESDVCPSGYAIIVAKGKLTCILPEGDRVHIYTGEVRGCGHFNGKAFVVTETTLAVLR